MVLKRKFVSLALAALLCLSLAACGGNGGSAGNDEGGASEEGRESVELVLAAAASLENCFENELIPLFESMNQYSEDEAGHVSVQGVYDSSGKLQQQIENGLEADVFMSAAEKQMNALVDEGYIDSDKVVRLLKNKLVLIKQKGADTAAAGFESAELAESIAIGDPDSVPAGQYAKEALEKLGNYDKVAAKASFGTNVTEVLSWVEQGSAEVGMVYATDAASSDKIEIIEVLGDGILENEVVYPLAPLSASENPEIAQIFVDFLQRDEALAIFEKYGFTVY